MSWERIDRYRIRTGKNLADVAEKIGVGVSMLMMVKSGKRALSSKAMYRLEQAEIEAGLRGGPAMREAALDYGASDQKREMLAEMGGIKKELDQLTQRVDDLIKRMQ